MVYTFENISPYQLLKAKYKGGTPTDRDKKIIEDLLVDQKLAPGVVNVLISYVLKINNEQLNKNYIETIAGQWKRLNIETVEAAMRFTEKKHKELNKVVHKEKTVTKKVKEEKLPAWFNKEQEINESTKEEIIKDKYFLKTKKAEKFIKDSYESYRGNKLLLITFFAQKKMEEKGFMEELRIRKR